MENLQNMDDIKNVISMLQMKVQKMESQLQNITKENAQLKSENQQLTNNLNQDQHMNNVQTTSLPGKDSTKFNVNDIIYHLKHSPGFKPPYITIDIQKELEEILFEDNENM